MVGESVRTSRCPGTPTPAVVAVEIVLVAAAASAVIAVVIVITRVASGRSRVHWLHRDLGSGLGRGVENLCPWVVLCPELYSRLHGDLGLLGEAVAAVRGRGAAVARGRCAI